MVATGGDVHAAMLLSRLRYLNTRRDDDGRLLNIQIHNGDDRAVPVTYENLSEWLLLTTEQLKRAVAMLEDRELIRVRRGRHGRGTPYWYSLTQLSLGIVLLHLAGGDDTIVEEDEDDFE